MDSIKFKYSVGQMIKSIIKLILWAVIGCWMVSILRHDPNSDISDNEVNLIFDAVILLLIVDLLYLSIYFYIPCLKGEIALELDEQKLKYNIKGKLRVNKIQEYVYWKEVRHFNYEYMPQWNLAIVRVKMKNGDKLGLQIQNVAGNNDVIVSKITEYFDKYK